MGQWLATLLGTAMVAVCSSATAAWAYDAELRWSAVAVAAGYRVYMRQGAEPFGAGIDAGNPAAAGDGMIHYVVTDLTEGVGNYFAITAYDERDRKSVV